VLGAGLVAVTVAFVLRPAQLVPHAPAEPVVEREPERPAPPSAAPELVYVAGAVVHPGVYPVTAGARARDALAKAGGATGDADLVAVNLAARVADGDEIAVPRRGEGQAAPRARSTHRRSAAAGERRSRRRPRRSDAPAADGGATVDLNAADAQTLAALPGIGPVLADRIVAFRDANGPFASVDGLADVAGITPSRLNALVPYLNAGR
jgi:competence protein ComEA